MVSITHTCRPQDLDCTPAHVALYGKCHPSARKRTKAVEEITSGFGYRGATHLQVQGEVQDVGVGDGRLLELPSICRWST